MTVDDWEQVKREVEDLRQRRDRAVGRRQQLLAELKKEYGVEDVKAARKLLKKLHADMMEKSARWKTLLAKFKEQLEEVKQQLDAVE